MECPNCGGQMGLEDEVCPYCHTPNEQAIQHQSDMAHFRQEYQRTQADVIQRASLMQRHGSWLVILVVLLVAIIIGIVLNVAAWDIGYSIREGNVLRAAAQDHEVMDGYLAEGEYGLFVGYYDAHDISFDDSNPYQGTYWAAYSYVDLMRYISAIHDKDSHLFKPEYISGTCEHLADGLIRIYTLEERYQYDRDRYLPADQLAYIEDIRERTAVIAKAYFGLTDEDIQEIPNMSTKKLAALIEEGIQR